jgi:hypothetical protein
MDRAANAKHSLIQNSVLFLSVTLLPLALVFPTLASIVVNRKAGLKSFRLETQPTYNTMKQIQVYYNFHKKLFSVQEKVNGKWKVVEHTNNIFIRNASFKVSEAGRLRVIKEMRKNVHAKIVGERFPFIPKSFVYRDEVSYNPYKGPNFMVVKEQKPLDWAKYVTIIDGKVIALIPEFQGVRI